MDAKVIPGLDNETLRNVLDSIRPRDEKDTDITVKKAMDYWDISRETAQVNLKQLYEEGKLTREWVKLKSGHMGYVYRLPKV